MVKKKLGLGIECLNIVGSIIMITLLVTMLLYAFQFWSDNFPRQEQLNGKMFWISLIFVVLTVTFQWMDGRIKSVDRSIQFIRKSWEVKKWQKKRKQSPE